MPDPTNMFSSGINVYTTFVAIDETMPGMRPGMSAEVTILVDQKDDVVAVPVQAVYQAKGKDEVYVLTLAGQEKRQVKLGMTNDKLIEVKEGLNVGETVALNPTALMSESDKRDASAVSIRPSSNQAWSGSDAADSKKAGAAKPAGDSEKGKGAAGKGGAGKGAGGRGGMGGMMSPEERAAFMKMSPDEQRKLEGNAACPRGWSTGSSSG